LADTKSACYFTEWMRMQFCFFPALESGCPNVSHCRHLCAAAVGTLVKIANFAGQSLDELDRMLDGERERVVRLVEEKQ